MQLWRLLPDYFLRGGIFLLQDYSAIQSCRAQEHKAVSTLTLTNSNPHPHPVPSVVLGARMWWKMPVFRTDVLLMRHQSSWPAYSPKVILHEHVCSTLSPGWQEKLLQAGVQQVIFFIKKQYFFFLQCSWRTKGFIYRSLFSMVNIKTSF